jgi:cell division septation protein DedD
MKNREFRELQVSSTQLAIIFFGILIIGVVIFLLGVSVGKKHGQASLKTSSVLAQKAPDQAKDRLIIPEAKTERPQTVEAPKPAPAGESQPPARTAEASPTGDISRSAPGQKEAAAPAKPPEALTKAAPSPSATETPKAPPAKPSTAVQTPAAVANTAKPGPKVETAAPPKKGLYYVQVGALAEKAEATAVSQRYKAQGYSVVVLDPQPTDRKPLFRVRIGGFATKEEADSVRAKLAAGSGRRVDYFTVRD